MGKLLRSAVPAICVLTLSEHAGADVVASPLNPVADVFVASGASPAFSLSADNFGAAGALAIAPAALPKGVFQSVLKFDLSSAKTTFDSALGIGQWKLQTAALTLTGASANNAIFNNTAAGNFSIDLMQNNSWVEGAGTPSNPGLTGITLSTLPGFEGVTDQTLGTYTYDGSASGHANYSLALGSFLQSDAAAGSLLSLRLYAADNVISYISNSENFGTAANRPALGLTAISLPEPGSLALLTIGGTLMLARRRAAR